MSNPPKLEGVTIISEQDDTNIDRSSPVQVGDGTTVGRSNPIQIGSNTDWVCDTIPSKAKLMLGDRLIKATK